MSVQITRDEDRPTLPRPHPGFGLLASVAVALFIALGEIDHLLAQVLAPDGRTWSVSSLSGLTAALHWGDTRDGWSFVSTGLAHANAAADGWLRWYAVTDALLAVTYGALGYFWFRRRRARTPGPDHALPPLRGVRIRDWGVGEAGTWLVLIGAGADLLENVQLLFGVPWPLLIILTGIVKWLALAPAAILAVISARRGLARLPKALYTHRYSAAIVLPLSALSLGRGPDLLEQIPDIQRRWADAGGHDDFVWAGFVMLALGVATAIIGRQRTGHLWLRTCPRWTGSTHPCAHGECPVEQRRTDRPMPLPLVRLWFIGPVVLAVAAVALAILGADVRPVPLVVFCLFPVAIGAVSLGLRARWHGGQEHRPQREPISRARFETTALVGDVLVGLLPVVAGLGVIRAFTAPDLLSGVAGWWSALMMIAAVVCIVAAFPALAFAHDLLEVWRHTLPPGWEADNPFERVLVQLTPGISMDRGTPPTDDPDAPMGDRVRAFLQGFAAQRSAWTVLLVSGVAMVAIALLPVFLAEHVGVIATFQLALGSISVLVAASVILFQPGGSPEAFWPLRIPFAPVTTLIVLSMLFAGIAGGDDVHRIRPYTGPYAGYGQENRPQLDKVFEDWLRNGRSCATDLEGTDLKIRPMLMYAAEGGGIRAAYWTTKAIDRISTPPTATGDPVAPVCRSALISSGASGGSVGLSIASVTDPGSAARAVIAIAGPEALGAAADGLILRDTIYAATGVPVPSLRDRSTKDAAWSDRGTLIEQAWEDRIPELDRPWIHPRPGYKWSWGATGALVVNSTSPTTSCRTLISQVTLPGQGTSECEPGQPAAASTDLVQCTGQMRTVTAALLTARFPYVTPSGVVTCPGPDGSPGTGDEVTEQIVDGGYAENTGVGTLLDLMPRVLADVRHHNNCVLATTPPRPPGCIGEPALDTLVAPQLVYFDNGTGSDLVERPSGVTLEALVPPITILRAKGALFSARAQLERMHAMLATDQLWESSSETAETVAPLVDAWRPNQVAVVFQETRPSIAAPLGWVLSSSSIAAMDAALCRQKPVEDLDFGAARDLPAPLDDTPDVAPPAPPTTFGTIDDVLDVLPGGSAGCD